MKFSEEQKQEMIKDGPRLGHQPFMKKYGTSKFYIRKAFGVVH